MGDSHSAGGRATDDQFNLVVSTVHELKSPLVLIQGLTSMLLENEFGKLTQDQRDAIERIGFSSRRMLKLIDGLLSVGRWREKRPNLTVEPIMLSSLLNSVLNELRPTMDKKHIFINSSFGKVLPTVLGDWQMVYQIMFNLLDNALKYSPPRSTIRMRVLRKNSFLQVKISDQGAGINPKELGILFERFGTTSTKPVDSQTGSSGLGLFIVKNLIELHGGYVSVTPLTSGTCFSIGLPINAQLPLFSAEGEN
jgi:two-component system, OmpR family, phosphate regulon sensor histidine kinase PhoR